MTTKVKQKNDLPFITVWIVDDNTNYCKALAVSLNSSKQIRCDNYFHSAVSAVKFFSITANPPTVLLLDIKMPGESGIDSIEQILQISPNTIILMLTAVDDEDQIKTALISGASGYLLKTSSSQDIIRGIETAFHGGSPLDPMITKKILSFLVPTKKAAPSEYKLSKRQDEIIRMIVKGWSIIEIGEALNISRYTVETHLKNLYHKLDVHNKHSLVAKAYHDHLID